MPNYNINKRLFLILTILLVSNPSDTNRSFKLFPFPLDSVCQSLKLFVFRVFASNSSSSLTFATEELLPESEFLKRDCYLLKAISHKKEAPWIFAHYQKIYNFHPILMKHGGNDHLIVRSFSPSFMMIGKNCRFFGNEQKSKVLPPYEK